ncbi:hypothetical protein CBS101457_003765 [Exobasidium rhododendri]|nr:hypothetical protein CBS101457_003765 [Exobasidium rhododendri]
MAHAKHLIPPHSSTPLYNPHDISSQGHESPTSSRPLQLSDDSHLTASGSTQHSPSVKELDLLGRRGRRRRSSEYVQGFHTDDNSVRGEKKEEDIGEEATSSALLWWQRPRREDVDEEEEHVGSSHGMPSRADKATLPPLRTDATVQDSSSLSPSLRSPAAAFLSSMNDTSASQISLLDIFNDTGRAYSLSPNRGHSHTGSMSDASLASLPRLHSHLNSEGSSFGLTGAAAHLYSSGEPSTSRSNFSTVILDENGARIGPKGRYLLGRSIGFGGFSTVREAWDLGSDADGVDVHEDKTDIHRVAVKITHSEQEEESGEAATSEDDELRIWETIPSHPNLLPLLHHERTSVVKDPSSRKVSTTSFLVMPFCEGSLLSYVKSEGKLPSSDGSAASTSLSRTASLQHSHGAGQNSVDSPVNCTGSPRASAFRTGSGFVHRSHMDNRVASVPLSSVMGRSPSLAYSPTRAGENSSYILRRASSRISRTQRQSNGVPFSAARDIMRQLTEALLCLHTKAGVLHGDLKLENVLGQRSVSHFLCSQDEETALKENNERYGTQSIASLFENLGSTNEIICWRIADFGLAKRVDIHHSDINKKRPHAHNYGGSTAQSTAHHRAGGKGEENRSKTTDAKAKVGGGVRGSLAYTAPETFLPGAVNGGSGIEEDGNSISPFAPDMWALGCILYALCSGKLPFSDTFEPRLQMKIAKGTWDLPERLKRFPERKIPTKAPGAAAAPTTSTTAATGNHASLRERDRSSSSNGTFVNSHLNQSINFSASLKATRQSPHSKMSGMMSAGVNDMSASMPALQERGFMENTGGGVGGVTRSTSQTSMIDHKTGEAFEEGESHLQQEEANSESDDDERIDQVRDGDSQDRVEIRSALRHLLEPDPRKRWSIEQLSTLPWISGANPAPTFSLAENEEDHRLQVVYPGNISSVRLSTSQEERPTLAQTSISEHPSQESVAVRDDDVGRGRSKRREFQERKDSHEMVGAATPINIDRSTSRSQSRPRMNRMISSPWEMDGNSSFEKKLLEKHDASTRGGWDGFPVQRLGQRSNSADTHSRGGRSTSSHAKRSASRPRQMDLSKSHMFPMKEDYFHVHATSARGKSDAASHSSSSRSRSRARDALQEITEKEGGRDASPSVSSRHEGDVEERLWWQRGRKGTER